MKKILAAIALTAISFAANATDYWHTSMIKYIYPQGNGDVVLAFVNDSPQCPNGGQPKYHYISVGANGVNADGFKNIYATAMLAFAMGKPLNINFSDSGTSCVINRAYIAD